MTAFPIVLGMDYYSDARTATAPGPRGIPGEIVGADDNGLGFVGEYQKKLPPGEFKSDGYF